MRFRNSTVILILGLAAVATAAPVVQAQQPVLEEIIVTAQKREQSLQDVPIAISTLSGTEVHDLLSGSENIRALNGRLPSLVVESSNGRQSPRFYIRGLGNTDFDVNANQPVSMVYDEVSLENSVLKAIPVFDIERIEVLRGPQGTLFGRNTPAGIIKIDSVKPTQEFGGYGLLSYGSRGTALVEAALNGAVSDTTSARLSIMYQSRDNWIDNTVDGPGNNYGEFDELALRFQMLFEPTENFRGLLILRYFDQNGSQPQIFYANAFTPGIAGLRPGFDEQIASHDGSASFNMEHFGATVNLQFTFDNDMLLTSISAYDTIDSFSRADVDGGLVGGFDVIGVLGRQAFFNVESGDGLKDHYQFTQEFRLSQQVDKTFYQVGAYYFKENIDVVSINYNSATTLPTDTTDALQKTESKALFGQVAYDISDQMTLTGGLRYTWDDKHLQVVPGPGSFAPAATIKADDSYFNWDLSLSYDVNDEWTLYGRAGSASRGPVTLGRFGFTSSADTETLTSIEAGFKAVLMGGRARWNADVYSFNIKDQQLTATGGVGNTNELLNADKTTGSGFETDLEILVTDNLRLLANASYNKTKIKDPNLLAEQCGGTPKCTGLDPVVDEFIGFFGPVTLVSIDGNPLPRAPKWLFNAAATYTVPLSSGEMYFNTDWNYRTKSNIFLYESVEFVAVARWLGGLRIGWRNEAGNLDVAFVGRNITDEITAEGGIDFLNLTAFVNEPRYWGGEVRYNF